MKRIIFIVSRKQPDLVPRLEQQCRGSEVEIVVDRRVDERRKSDERPPVPDRRHFQRRIYSNASDLELIGIAVSVHS